MNNERLAFQGNKEVVATKGVKVRNRQKELTSEQKQKLQQQKLDDAAGQYVQNIQQRDADGAVYFKNYIASLQNKQLQSNKGEIGKVFERDMVASIIELATKKNNDPKEEYDGMGTIPVLNLLLKTTLFQRDRINELEYRLVQLESKLNQK